MKEMTRWSWVGGVGLAFLLAGCGGGGGPVPKPEAAPKAEEKLSQFPTAPVAAARPHDWFRWRGPDANGVSTETNWTSAWPISGPKRLWKASVGVGFSGVSVSRGRLFTMGHVKENDVVFALTVADGKVLWTHPYPAALHDKYYPGGPSATPTVDGGVVYTLGKAGDVFCLEASTGKVVWWVNLVKELGLEVPTWGFAGSPFVHGNLLILNAGDHGVALDKITGQVKWTSGKAASGYASPVPFEMDGTAAVAIFGSDAIMGVKADDGEELWSYPWKTDYDANIGDPIVAGDRVFVSSGYDAGCALIRFEKGDTELVWKSKAMRNHFNSCVLVGGFIYGIDGQADDRRPELKCLALPTGDVKWSEPMIGGMGALTAAGDRLVIMQGSGELLVVQATPDRYKPLARAQVLGGRNWTVPVLSNGRLYCRNARGDLVCLDVAAELETTVQLD